ncbi:MAG: CHAT domain-containing protein, partial [Vicinamibacterales bacterium]
MTYQDFDLSIERVADGFRARVLALPSGASSIDFHLPFTEIKLENFLLRLGRTRRAVRRVESSEMQAAKTFGASLFSAVFSGAVGASFHRSQEEARRHGAGLRVRLRLADAELADLPWEYLYNPAVNRFLALSVQTPLVRYMDLPDPIQPVAVTPPIRALVMIASPNDYPSLDVEAEWKKLTESLGDLLAVGHISVDRLDDASLPALQRCLRRSQYHMFHFIGHGEFDQASQEGVLILEDAKHRGYRVGSQYLGMLLHDHESLRVAILNACEGARTSRTDPFAGSAQTLVQQGIPAVIAMQLEIADDVASTFAHEFYGALADGYPIDAALTEARKAIFAAGRDVEWGTPVLYLRAPDGRIFDVQHKGVQAAAIDKTSVVESPFTIELPADDKERAAALLRSAGVALAHGEYSDAQKLLHQAGALDPEAAGLRDLIATAEQQRAVADTRARRRGALRNHLAAATTLFAKADFSAALDHVREALRLRSNDPDALTLRAQIRKAMNQAVPQKPAREQNRLRPRASK